MKSGEFVKPHGAGCSVVLEVSPGAKKTEIIGINSWRGALQVKVAAEPRGGAANDELLAFLGKRLGLDKKRILLLKGERSSSKILFVPMPPDKVESILGGD